MVEVVWWTSKSTVRFEISKTTVGKLTVPGLFTLSLPIHARCMLRPHNVVLQYARRYTGVSSLRKHYTSVTRMPWLMKAEPDSRVVKGKDVKVRLRPLSLDETRLAVVTALIPVLSGRFRSIRVSPIFCTHAHSSSKNIAVGRYALPKSTLSDANHRCKESRGEEDHEREDEGRR